MRYLLVLLALGPVFLTAGEGGGHIQLSPEFEAEIAAEIEGNRQASIGKKKVDGIEVDWSPEHTVLRGSPKKLQAEMQQILASISKYPLLAPLAKHVQISKDGKTLDLTRFLSEVKKATDDTCWNCFALVLCVMKKKTKFMEAEQMLEALQNSHVKKKEKEAGPGSVMVMRHNFSQKMPYHAYIWLSPILAFEKRGSGAVLIRPQSVTEKEYKEMAAYERKYHKFVEGRKLPSLSSAATIEAWVPN